MRSGSSSPNARQALSRPPNILLLITDQQRYPRHWPDDPGWLRELTPNDQALAATGLTFQSAFCNTAMCSPSRATLLTGLFPAQHGVTLTHTTADLRPDPRNGPAVIATMLGLLGSRGAARRRILRQFTRGLLQLGPKSGNEPELRPETMNLARLLRAAGYEVAYKGKWHLTHPAGHGSLLGGWDPADAERIERDYGFAGWEPPDAGENAKAEHFGAGNAGPLGKGWDELYTRQAESWLMRSDLPEPFCLVVSLVNPHDVLGYPASYERGGYAAEEFRELGVELPPTVDENLGEKPTVHALMKMGMTAYLGPLRTRRAKLDYVNFYAHLHRLVDAKIGRVLDALGSADDPDSLRSGTVIIRCADHGEMGLSHGGLRQKMFNAYEETIHVPLIVSNPVLFPKAVKTDALASLIDLLPTVATLSGANLDPAQAGGGTRGHDLSPVLAAHAAPERDRLSHAAIDFSPITEHRAPQPTVQDAIHFTYDDHQAATALQNVPGQPNRIRAVRTERHKYALYFDPAARAPTEYELYDLERDPDEVTNLVDRSGDTARSASDRRLRSEMAERLDALVAENGTGRPPGATAA
ncbi:MAG: sulfatase-like hydrolase/transferase [Solirubrobacterales bacterium]